MKNILFYFAVIINVSVIVIFFIDRENIKEKEIFINVEIKGAVKREGVYKLKENSLVLDLINEAGGLLETADISVTNQSKKIKDEMVVIIYTKQEISEMRKGSTSVKYIEKECICPKIRNDSCLNEVIYNSDGIIISTGKISINSATLEELMTLPGIGENKALSIIKYRDENKGFLKIDDIMNVKGIGASIYEKIKDYLTL